MSNCKDLMHWGRYGQMEGIAAEIGYTAANNLVHWLGGEAVFVPETLDENHVLAKVIGLSPFKRLIKMYEGCKDDERRLWIPCGHERDIAQRDRLIGAMLREGKTCKDIAGLSGMTTRHVQQVRRRLEGLGLLPLIFEKGQG